MLAIPRCRSSTNNEDLVGFNGAGLYDSFTHRPDEGLAVIRKISQMHPSTRVLVLSGQDNKKHVFQAKEDGAVDFISKPCDIAEIKVRLKKQMIADIWRNMI